MIDGVREVSLKKIVDDRGAVMHMLRSSDPHFKQFGEIYFSLTNQWVIKGWYRHHHKDNNFAVPVGEIKLVLLDTRKSSSTAGEVNEFRIGLDQYSLITIPPMIWYGFQGLSENPALITNCATEPYCEGDSDRLNIDDPSILYEWR